MTNRIAMQVRRWRQHLGARLINSRLFFFFSILGPGIIAANADNDASGIFGYSLAGAQYQYRMLWVLVISTVALGVCQEICARMGVVTGKGLADLIRERCGVKITLLALSCLLVANFATTVSEFAGILAACGLYFGEAARWIVLPIVAMLLGAMVIRGTYRSVEIVLLCASSVYLLYVVSAVMAHPVWPEVIRQTVWPDFRNTPSVQNYVFMVINVVGTTITPWGQFYIQSSIRDKGIGVENYKHTRIDVLFGAFFTNFIAFFIVVACGATLYVAGVHEVNDAAEVAHALLPLAGSKATLLFCIGLFNASCFGAIAVPLSTAYAFTEALGAESAVGSKLHEAPLFIGVYSAMIGAAVLLVMLFPGNLAFLIILPNIVGAVLLPVILLLMLRLVNDRRLMGSYVNSRTYNAIAWTTAVVLIVLSLILLVTSLLPAPAARSAAEKSVSAVGGPHRQPDEAALLDPILGGDRPFRPLSRPGIAGVSQKHSTCCVRQSTTVERVMREMQFQTSQSWLNTSRLLSDRVSTCYERPLASGHLQRLDRGWRYTAEGEILAALPA